MKVVIIGAAAAGLAAATRLRRLNEGAEIVVLERADQVAVNTCGLPFHLGDADVDPLVLAPPTGAELAARYRLDLRLRHEVRALDRSARTVSGIRLDDGEPFSERYDCVILATGAAPVLPDVPGVEHVRTLRDLADAGALARLLADTRRAVVIGGGFIGLEVADNLVRHGLSVSIVEAGTHLLAPLDPELAQLIRGELALHGVDVRLGRRLARVDEGCVRLDDDTELAAELVVAATGVRPSVRLAAEAGLALGPLGGIEVDEIQCTSDPRIYAVGDAVEKRDGIVPGPVLVPLAGPAIRQGRLVADAICGRDVRNAAVLGTAIVGVFGTVAATVGWSEERLRAKEISYAVVHAHPSATSLAVADADRLHLKLLFDPRTGRILGAQGVGGEGLARRIDVIATAMRGGLPASALLDLDLAYAPQFGAAKDPVNVLGYLAENTITRLEPTLQWHELPGCGLPVLDVRTPGEFEQGSIPAAVNIPLETLRDRLDEVPAECVVCSRDGLRGHAAARLLAQYGKRVHNLDGGYLTWLAGYQSQQ